MKNPVGSKPGRQRTIRRLFAFAWQYRRECTSVLILQIILLVLGMAGLALSGLGIDVIRAEMEGGIPPPKWPFGLHPPVIIHGMKLLWFVIAGVLACALVRAVLTYFYETSIAKLVQGKIVVRLRSETFEKMQQLDFRFFDSNASGSLINRITGDVQSVRMFIDGVIIQCVVMLLSLAVYIAYMVSIHLPLTLACLATTPLIWLLSVLFAKTVRLKYLQSRALYDEIILWLSETIRGIIVVKAFAFEGRAFGKFERRNRDYREQQSSIFNTLGIFIPSIDFITQVNIVVLLGYGGWLVIHNQIALGTGLVVFAGVLQQFGAQVSNVGNIMNSVQQSLAAAERVFEIMDAPVAIESAQAAHALENPKGRIDFENVSFGYDKDELALEGVSFSALPGQCVGIIGPTGSGKSTLLSLIPRFYDPQSGRVLMDGQDMRLLRLEDLRSQTGTVFQESFLFSTTVADNIAFGHTSATREQIITAAKTAAADAFIRSLPEGYDTVLRENGSSLSGGQRQRLAIARAILANPRILLLDDPTAAVDAPTEREILDGMELAIQDRTVFLATHRLAALRRTDFLLVMENGRIVQTGRKDELGKVPGYYRSLLELQTEALDEI